MTYLAVKSNDGACSIAQISSAEGIPKEFTAKVLKELCRSGFIRSRLGPHGGYRLARPPDEMTVLDIMEALDGPMVINDCLADPSFCNQVIGCRMHRLFGEVNTAMKKILGSATISDIALEGGRYDHLPEENQTKQVDISVRPGASKIN